MKLRFLTYFPLLFPLGLSAGHAAQGGPDLYGYTWADSNSGVPFEWIDTPDGLEILTATSPNPRAASFTLAVPWGGIYGEPVSELQASRNGYLTDLLTGSGNDETNDCPLPTVPSAGGNGFRIYPLHNHIELDANSGQILYEYFPESPHSLHRCGVHVITWKDVYHVGQTSETFSFQTLLFDNLDILFQYGPGNPSNGQNSTTGIQNGLANLGLSIYCDEKEIPDDFAILIQPPMLTVNTSDDEFDSPAGASVSLREAIRDVLDGGRITISPSLNRETVDLSSTGGGQGSSIDLNMKAVAIDASGLNGKLNISGGDQVGHLNVNGWLSVDNLHFERAKNGSMTVSGGLVACRSSWLENENTDSPGGDGGAIYLIGAGAGAGFYLCDFIGNTATKFGGAIYSENATLRAEKCHLWRNRTLSQIAGANVGGGAVYLKGTDATLRFCDFAMNSAFLGGALNIENHVDLDCFACTFDDNRAVSGGAVSYYSQLIGTPTTTLFRRCTFFGNCAKVNGGAIFESAVAPIIDLDTWQCTFYKNQARNAGGAFYLADTTCNVAGIIMADNGDDQLTVQSGRPGGLDTTFLDNIETGSEGNFAMSNGLSNIEDIGLTDLGHFGGFVRVCMPLQHSPVIDQATGGQGVDGPIDARGFPSFADGGAPGFADFDVGAVELGPSVVVTTSADSGPGSLREALLSVVSGGVVTFDDDAGGSSPTNFVKLGSSNLVIPGDKTVLIDGSPVGTARIHNLGVSLSGESLALHAIDATADTNLGRIAMSGDGHFTADRCSFLGHRSTNPSGLLTLSCPASILRSTFCDFQGIRTSQYISSSQFFVARDSQWLDNGNISTPVGLLIYKSGGVGCVQRCSFVGNALEGRNFNGAIRIGASGNARTRAWFICESSTFSSNDLVDTGLGSTEHSGMLMTTVLGGSDVSAVGYIEANHNTFFRTRSSLSGNGAIKLFTLRPGDTLKASFTGNILAENGKDIDPGFYATIASGGHNLSDGAPAFFTGSDLPNQNPLLGPAVMGRHGTLVNIPRHGSPCIDAIPAGGIPATGCHDGRGFWREFDANGNGAPQMDIGAVESGRLLTVTISDHEDDGDLGLGLGDSFRECLDAAEDLGGGNIAFAPGIHNSTLASHVPNTIAGFADIDGLGSNISAEGMIHAWRDGVVTVTGLTLNGTSLGSSRTADDARLTLRSCRARGHHTVADTGHAALLETEFSGFDDFDLFRIRDSGSALFDGCAFHGNTIEETRGILYSTSGMNSRFFVKDSVFARNAGKVMQLLSGSAYISNCTTSRNVEGFRQSGSSFTFYHNVLATNNGIGTITGSANDVCSLGENLLQSDHPAFDKTGDQRIQVAYLAPLADYNGDGLPETPPLAASPAFNTTVGAVPPPVEVVTVTTNADENDTPAGPDISLREAIRDIADGGTIIFAPEMNNLVFKIGTNPGHTFDKSLTIDATSLPLGIDLTTRLQWSNGHTVALHGVHIRDIVTSINGGSIRCVGSGGTFIASHCTFSNNNTSAQGGGIYVQNGTLVLENCTIAANRAGSRSAIGLPNSTARIEFCTIADGASTEGAINGTSDVAFGSNLVFGNRDNGAIADTFGNLVNFTSLGYNHFEDRPAGTNATDVLRATTLPTEYPTFSDFGGWTNTYRPKTGASPIDFTPATAVGIAPPPEHDARGFVRVAGSSADGGAHESSGSTWDSDGDGLPDWWEQMHGLDPNTPNDLCADDDQDGTNLGQEYAWLTDPNDASSHFDSNLDPIGTFTFNTIPGFTYTVQGSLDLTTWPEEVSLTATGDSITVPVATLLPRLFIRVTRP